MNKPSMKHVVGTNWAYNRDPKSNRVYYINLLTKQTQWNKPLELCTSEEKAATMKKLEETKLFFKEMVENIKLKVLNCKHEKSLVIFEPSNNDDSFSSEFSRPATLPTRIRTISAVDG